MRLLKSARQRRNQTPFDVCRPMRESKRTLDMIETQARRLLRFDWSVLFPR
jgi:hypothetical protein